MAKIKEQTEVAKDTGRLREAGAVYAVSPSTDEAIAALKRRQQAPEKPDDGLGFLRLFGFLGGVIPHTPENYKSPESDLEAMRGDWRRVGDDLRIAMLRHQDKAQT